MNSISILAILMVLPAEGRRTAVVEVVEKAAPAVVNIGAEIVDTSNPFQRRGPFDDVWREFFGAPRRRPERSESLGSGVIIDRSGLVLTNEHVVARATSITITLADRGASRPMSLGPIRILTSRSCGFGAPLICRSSSLARAVT